MKIRPINGMGEAKPLTNCEGCDADVRGRSTHLVNWDGERGWVCDACHAQRPVRVEAHIADYPDPERGTYLFLGAGREHKGAFPGVYGIVTTEPRVAMPGRWNAETETFE